MVEGRMYLRGGPNHTFHLRPSSHTVDGLNVMSNEQIEQAHGGSQRRPVVAADGRWGRLLAIAAAVLFCISSAFPAVAGFVKDTESWPKWWGRLDVGLAFVLALSAFAIVARAQGRLTKRAEESAYHAYRIMTHGILVMLAAVLLLGDWIVWGQCLTGFGWRAWLLLYCLPAWFTLFSGPICENGADK
jgi:hypothetical protein